MANFFITGGKGFVGSHLIDRLCRRKNKIWCLTRRPVKHPHRHHSIVWIKADLLKPESYIRFIERADYIFHLAGILSARKKEDYFKINVLGTEAILKACREVGSSNSKFVYMSSIAAMGPARDGTLLRESDLCVPNTEYGKSKLHAEQIIQQYQSDIPAVILRPSFIYGRGDMRGLKFIQSLFHKSISYWNLIIRTISLCHISDVIQSCLLAIKEKIKSGEVFIISDSEIYTWKGIMDIIEQVANDLKENEFFELDYIINTLHKTSLNIDANRKKRVNYQYWGCDISKAKDVLKFKPQISLRKGARDTIRWYINKGFFDLKVGMK